MFVTRMEKRGQDRVLSVLVSRVENPNLEPAPRDLFVVVVVGTVDRPERIVVEFAGRLLGVDGNERPLDDLPPPQVIPID